ncbi:mitochondrial carrier homolog 1-like [Adelges cooleyi]|uniref:mitochondrial carrier homolog 1-like n=1 Tax=Adelges cooleyi TaxID=133065 RepID=UPI0021805548|nr:mitochondrial carrier homolog 1-like [Adelges cooleyi]
MDAEDIDDRDHYWKGLTSKCLIKSSTHPLEYAKLLIQIGHEPIPPMLCKPLIGQPCLVLPNIFSYTKYIYEVDGFKGMYAGLAPKLVGVFVEHSSSWFMTNYVKFEKKDTLDPEDSDLKGWEKCLLNTTKELVCSTTSVLLSYPFRLITIRMMAQFVGFEHRYTGIFSSFAIIYREEGITGFYSGLWPSLMYTLSYVIISNVAKHAITRYLFNPSTVSLTIADFASSYCANFVAYPFNVVSSCIAINNCGLAAGMPPEMPVFGNWVECMKYLYGIDQLGRGASYFYRRHVTPARSKLIKLN